jgi:hypothetical protein
MIGYCLACQIGYSDWPTYAWHARHCREPLPVLEPEVEALCAACGAPLDGCRMKWCSACVPGVAGSPEYQSARLRLLARLRDRPAVHPDQLSLLR